MVSTFKHPTASEKVKVLLQLVRVASTPVELECFQRRLGQALQELESEIDGLIEQAKRSG